MSLSRGLMFPRLASMSILSRRSVQTSARLTSGHHLEYWWGPQKAAGREMVGFGATGDEVYQDRLDYWYPAIRFRVEDDIIRPIRQKEKSDWKSLTLEEKKLLYRYSFRQTLAEYEAPNGYWKLALAAVAGFVGLATLYITFLNHFAFPKVPPTFQNEYKEAQVERMLALDKGKFLGAPTHYDYENERWKK